jgi:hypothetical protein
MSEQATHLTRITLNLSGDERRALTMLLDAYIVTDLSDPDRDVLRGILAKLGITWHPTDRAV